MEKYGALRAISLAVRIAGWSAIAASVIAVFAVAFAFNPPPYNNFLNAYVAGFSVTYVVIGIALLGLLGLIVAAFGEALRAIADIADNSADTAENSARTVAFFNHINSRANRSAPSAASDVSKAA